MRRRVNSEGSIVALKRALEAMPTYAPAILSMGSVLYQSGRITEGRELFQSLLSLPKHTTDIRQIIDEAGTFLTRFGAYEDGMVLYRTAVKRYPDDPALFQGLGYCASNAGLHEEAVSANRRALELEPENQKVGQRPRLDSLTGWPPPAGSGNPGAGSLDGSER
jgi:Tfp pilus assembly protein PilF